MPVTTKSVQLFATDAPRLLELRKRLKLKNDSQVLLVLLAHSSNSSPVSEPIFERQGNEKLLSKSLETGVVQQITGLRKLYHCKANATIVNWLLDLHLTPPPAPPPASAGEQVFEQILQLLERKRRQKRAERAAARAQN